MSHRGDDREYYIRRGDSVDVAERPQSRSRTPGFMMRDERTDGQELVLRSRKVESGYTHRRSPSPIRVSERRITRVARSLSPDSERVVIRDRSRSRPPAEARVRVFERERERDRSVSPEGRVRIVNRERSRSADRFRAKIVERESRRISRSPSPEPPKVIKGPTIEREVITHWRDIDHGVIRASSPSPPPARRSLKETDIDIDVYHHDHRNHHHTDVDIDIQHGHSPIRHRSRSRGASIIRRKSVERIPPARFSDDTEVIIRSDRDRLRFESDSRHIHRSHSAAPIRSPSPSYSEEADYITSRINARGRMGEAWNGHTKDWEIIDVPPGTERVRMDGVGGGSADVTWSRYSGVRRSKFIPERERERDVDASTSSGSLVITDSPAKDSKLSVQIYDKEREIEVETSHRHSGARISNEMWTEITKDLVLKEAIEEKGYDYNETEWFYYIMEYLKYDDVLELVNISDRIRDARRRRAKLIEWERNNRDHHHHIDIHASHSHSHSHSHSRSRRHRSRSRPRHWDANFERDREVIVDRDRYY